jgi:hypothetical protein
VHIILIPEGLAEIPQDIEHCDQDVGLVRCDHVDKDFWDNSIIYLILEFGIFFTFYGRHLFLLFEIFVIKLAAWQKMAYFLE